MAVTLNRRAYEHAKELIDEGRFVFDERDDWSEHQPSALQESEYIRRHGFAEYGKWFLGINDERPENTKAHYAFPSEISGMFTAVACWLRKAGPANTGITTSRMRPPTCTACWKAARLQRCRTVPVQLRPTGHRAAPDIR